MAPDVAPPAAGFTSWTRPRWRLAPPGALVLDRDEIHLWKVALDGRADEARDRLLGMLSDDERARAGRFHFARDRWRFVVGRAALRLILGRYMEYDPARLRFAYGPQGKPRLRLPAGEIRFNVSHSSGLGLVAVSRGRRVGVDLEAVRPITDVDALAEGFLSVAERRELRCHPKPLRPEAFLRLWTRKEARLKGAGIGIAALGRAADPAPLAPPLDGAGEWWVGELTPADRYLAAVAVEGGEPRLTFWTGDSSNAEN